MIYFISLLSKKFFIFTLLAFLAFSFFTEARAQEENIDAVTGSDVIDVPVVIEIFPPRPLSPAEELPLAEEMIKRVNQKKPEISIDQMGSVFLTSIEENVIIDARKGLITRAPTDMEFDDEQDFLGEKFTPTGPREVSLGGVLYVSSDEWAVWINSEKITPKSIPSSIIDIRVGKDFVKLKWFDVQTNQIFPIKLRAHQRFNLDARIFLPGTE